jgi:hypothetical protein
MLVRYKHSSLSQKFAKYGRKTFYNIGPWSELGNLFWSSQVIFLNFFISSSSPPVATNLNFYKTFFHRHKSSRIISNRVISLLLYFWVKPTLGMGHVNMQAITIFDHVRPILKTRNCLAYFNSRIIDKNKRFECIDS